ncbi:MAG: response regulator [Chitinivibrionales bacterium]|nr:response regulator [Chitinivibrionales bacterium]MBD3356929.1 response regulator [Chitinivibrionales bacterium]
MKKILIADDAAEIRRLLSATLDPDEYRVIEAHDGLEAVRQCGRHKPDAVIMDIRMPGRLNGIEATRMIKESVETCNCRIVVLSGLGNEQYVAEALAAGASAYLTKPFSPLELLCKIEELLGID